MRSKKLGGARSRVAFRPRESPACDEPVAVYPRVRWPLTVRTRPYGRTDLGFAENRGLLFTCESFEQSRMQRRSVMGESTIIVAFDQHAKSVMAAVLAASDTSPALHPLNADLPTIGRFVAQLRERGELRCCYEAGPCGFALQRFLTERGIPCEVIAPGLIPRRAGNRIKTDRRDARQLAILYRAGALTPIHVPSRDEEAVRDLLRCREDTQTDLVRARHRLSKFLLRHDRQLHKDRARVGRETYRMAQWPALDHSRARANVCRVSTDDPRSGSPPRSD